ncbi:hypothetical protein LA52FAK_27290 [Desulforhopalus sp. 52FAK]
MLSLVLLVFVTFSEIEGVRIATLGFSSGWALTIGAITRKSDSKEARVINPGQLDMHFTGGFN